MPLCLILMASGLLVHLIEIWFAAYVDLASQVRGIFVTVGMRYTSRSNCVDME